MAVRGLRALIVWSSLLPVTAFAGEFGPADSASIQPMLAPDETIEAIEHAWFPREIGDAGSHRAGVFVVTSQRVVFLAYREGRYWPGIVIPWDRLTCAWLERLGGFADRLLAVQSRDDAVQTFTIGSGALDSTLSVLARIDARVGTGVDDSACIVVRVDGDFRHAASGITLPAKAGRLERTEIRRANGGEQVAARYHSDRADVVVSIRSAGSAALADDLGEALRDYRKRKAPFDWREKAPAEVELVLGAARLRALTMEIASDRWIPDHRRISVSRYGDWTLVVDSGYWQNRVKSAERQASVLLASLALPVTPPSP